MNPALRQIALRKMALPSIPNDWDVVTVGSIAQKKPNAIVGGPFGSDLVSTDYTPSGVPVIRGQNMGSSYVGGEFVFVSDEKAKVLNSNLATDGDVVFTQRGTLGQVSVVPERPFERYLISQSQMKLSVDPQKFNVTFLCHYFGSSAGQQQILESAIQTGVPHTNLTILRGYFLPNPTLHEQHAIADALSDADEVVAGLERVIAKKRLIKQGAAQYLLTARRRLPGFSGEWEVKPFGQIARIRNVKVQTVGNPVAQKCVELEQVEHETGRILFWVDATNRLTVKYQFEVGDVLFGRLRPYLRKFHHADTQGVCSTEIWPLMSNVVDSGFLYHVVQSDGFIAAACEAYGTHMPRADWGKLATYPVQAPIDPEEQVAIGNVLSDMEKEIQTLESRLTKARAVKEGMMQNLLTGRVRLV